MQVVKLAKCRHRCMVVKVCSCVVRSVHVHLHLWHVGNCADTGVWVKVCSCVVRSVHVLVHVWHEGKCADTGAWW